MNVEIEDFYKEHKTLNVNMNNQSQALNNKINFDSEKFSTAPRPPPPGTWSHSPRTTSDTDFYIMRR